MNEQGFVAAFGQTGQGDRGDQDGTWGDGPATFARSAPSIGIVLVYSQADQVLPFPIGLLPVLSDAVPQAVAHPTVHIAQLAGHTCQSEVIEPASLHALQASDALGQR